MRTRFRYPSNFLVSSSHCDDKNKYPSNVQPNLHNKGFILFYCITKVHYVIWPFIVSIFQFFTFSCDWRKLVSPTGWEKYPNSRNKQTPWRRRTILLEKLLAAQLVKFPTLYGTQRFITVFIWACHLSLSSATSVQSTTIILLQIYFNIILPSMPLSSNWHLSCKCMPHTPPSHLMSWSTMQPLIMHSSSASCCFIQLSPKFSTLMLNVLRLCSSLKVRDQGYIPVKNNRQNYSVVCSIAYVWDSKWKDKIRHQMVAGIPQFRDSCMMNRSSRFCWNVSAYRLN